MDQKTKPRLVLITPEITDAEAFAPTLALACETADVAAVIVRLAPANDAEQFVRIEMLAGAVHGIDAALLLDGCAHLVAQAGADGTFVSGDAIAAARSSVKNDHVVGAGRLETRHDAMTAAEGGADFVLFGDKTAEGKRPMMPSLIERVTWWAEVFVIPCVAYAAHVDEIDPLVRAGADFVALGEEAVWSATDLTASLEAANQRLTIAEHA